MLFLVLLLRLLPLMASVCQWVADADAAVALVLVLVLVLS